MKKMWCSYTCDPDKTRFVKALGTTPSPYGYNYTQSSFTVDPDYACTIFNSCKKTSFISEASISSSIAFLDFLGLNGKDTGKVIIYFYLDTVNSLN
jgi:Niemann-Pick C1 N terminus